MTKMDLRPSLIVPTSRDVGEVMKSLDPTRFKFHYLSIGPETTRVLTYNGRGGSPIAVIDHSRKRSGADIFCVAPAKLEKFLQETRSRDSELRDSLGLNEDECLVLAGLIPFLPEWFDIKRESGALRILKNPAEVENYLRGIDMKIEGPFGKFAGGVKGYKFNLGLQRATHFILDPYKVLCE